ncbi:unnamed protein product, partial [Medioppia subpectinata]
METIHKLVQSWLSEDEKKYLHLTNTKTIGSFIAIDQLPHFLKGTNTQSYRTVPVDAPSAHELSKRLGLKEGKAEKLSKHFEHEKIFPILDSYGNSLEKVSKSLIQELRQKAVERVEKNPELYYEKDVEKVKSNDWFVRRFLHNYKSEVDVNKGLEALDKALKWRKSY